MSSYSIIGLMSGTSMDGLDVAHCNFSKNTNGQWEHVVNQTKTFKYPSDLLEKIKNSFSYSAIDLLLLDKAIGAFFSEKVEEFAQEYHLKLTTIDAIASHGHTIFHQPEHGFTYQIGCGETMAYQLGIPVINDFRQKDVVAGGQGAPLVPIGDRLLFAKEADALLNIGGFCNICFPLQPETIAFDIAPGNLPLNSIAQNLGYDYDKDGMLSSQGTVNQILLEKLNNLSYYSLQHPKSLGNEWLTKEFMPLLNEEVNYHNQLRTCIEHTALQIVNTLNNFNTNKVMITGGGAKNPLLVNRIKDLFANEVHIPSEEIIDFKEAIIFAFLGALYLNKSVNSLSSVTGSQRDTIGGVLHIPS